ncbi:hypothetical protein V6N13_090190 [Hibiscus sabdariffa]
MDLFFTEPSYLCQWRSLQGGQATQNQKILEDRSQGDEEINREKSTGRNNGMRVKVKGNNGSKVDVLNLQSMKLEASRSLGNHEVRRVSGHVEEEDLWKMKRCLVGESSTVTSVCNIQDRLIKWGLGDIKVQRMGGKLYLLSFEDDELFLMLEDLNWSYLKEIFSKVEPWSEDIMGVARAVWIELSGIPLHCWNHITIKRIAELWGTFEAFGENIDHTLDCEKVTVLISTSHKKTIDESGKFQETKVVERAELELESSSETEAIAVERGSRSPERNQESQGEEYDAINVIFIGKENNDRSLHESRLLRGQISDLEFMSNGLKMSKKKAMEGNKTPVEEGANKQGVVGGQDVSLKSPRRNLVEEAKNSLESEPNVLKQNKVDPDFNLENGSKRAREDLSVSGLLQEKNDCMSGGLIIRKSAWEASVDDRMNAGLGNVTPNQEVNTVVNFSSNGEGPWDYFSEIRERKNKKERKYGSLWELQRAARG